MKTVDQATLLHWLDLDVDGQLSGTEKRQLDELLAADQALAKERRQLEILHEALGESRVDVREGFRDEVMASLPAAAWDRSASPAWRLPLAMMLILALGAAWSLGGVASEHPVASTGIAVLDFMQSTALAGAGIAVASWRGAGLGLEELMASSNLNLAALAFMVVCLNLLFVSMLRRPPKMALEAASEAGTRAEPAEADGP